MTASPLEDARATIAALAEDVRPDRPPGSCRLCGWPCHGYVRYAYGVPIRGPASLCGVDGFVELVPVKMRFACCPFAPVDGLRPTFVDCAACGCDECWALNRAF